MRNPPLHGVRVVGSNMISVTHGDAEVLYSYETPVAVKVHTGQRGDVYVTTKPWSRTTSKHIGEWLRTFGYSGTRDPAVQHVAQGEVERIASAGGAVREGYPDRRDQAGAIGYREARARRNPVDNDDPFKHDPDESYPYLGKFEGETWLTVQVASGEGSADEEIGSVDAIGWYALFTNFEASDGSKRHGILSEDSNGFMSFAESDTAEDAQAEFSQIVDEYNRFDEEQEQD